MLIVQCCQIWNPLPLRSEGRVESVQKRGGRGEEDRNNGWVG
jgi:hypothetical protein